MPKRTIKRFLPSVDTIKQNRYLKIFGHRLHDNSLWHLNRRSARGAFAVGLFMAWVPVPFQMILAAGGAIIFRVNLPLSVALVWITNPVTMPALFYFAYFLGSWILQQPLIAYPENFTWDWLISALSTTGSAFLLGCFILGTLFSLTGYFIIDIIWRWSVIRHLKQRKKCKKIPD